MVPQLGRVSGVLETSVTEYESAGRVRTYVDPLGVIVVNAWGRGRSTMTGGGGGGWLG